MHCFPTAMRPTRICAAVLCIGFAHAALAQGISVEPNITSSLIWSDNTTLGVSSEKRSDVIVDVRPSLRFLSGGPLLRLNGTVGLTSTSYVNGTESNDVAPQADLRLNAVLAQRFLFLDASVRSFESAEDLFGTRTDVVSTVNRYSTMQYALSPYIDRELSPRTRLIVRSDNTWTKANGADVPVNDGYFGQQTANFTIKPQPVGFGLQAEQTDTRYSNTSENLTREIARASVSAAYDAQIEVAAIFGHERTHGELGRPESSSKVYGGRLAWRPSDRTNFDLTIENRFFGTGWDLSFTHRTPFIAWNLSAQRQVSTYAERLFSLSGVGDVLSLLDAAFTTRFPDPVNRAHMIDEFLSQRGLSTTTQGAINVFSNRLDLFKSFSGTAAYIGPRDAASLRAYHTTVETLPGTDPFIQILFPSDVKQSGATINWSHRLTTQSALVTTLNYSEALGFNTNAGDRARQKTLRVEYNQALSPKTNGQIGARRQIYYSTVDPDGQESAVYLGVSHRF